MGKDDRPASWFELRWFTRPGTDWVVIGLLGLLVWWFRDIDWSAPFTTLPSATRRATYQTLATVSGTMLGLTLTSISILNSMLRQPAESMLGRVTSTSGPTISGIFFACVRSLALALLLSVVALIHDSESQPGAYWVPVALGAVCVLVVLRLTRMLYALSLLTNASRTPVPVARPTSQEERDGFAGALGTNTDGD
jgi:hypothetical protein